MTDRPYLTDAEIAEICEPLTQASAQVRYLASLGMIVHRKPNGRPLVEREHARAVLGGRAPVKITGSDAPDEPESPNVTALVLHLKARRGKKAQVQSA